MWFRLFPRAWLLINNLLNFAVTTHSPKQKQKPCPDFFLLFPFGRGLNVCLGSEQEHNSSPLHKSSCSLPILFTTGIDTTITSIQIMEIQQTIDHRYCSRLLRCGWVSLPRCPGCFWNLLNVIVLRLEWKPKLHVEIRVCLHCFLSKSTLGTWTTREFRNSGR